MLELFQAEWCPYSHRVRQRLTELGVDFVAKQVEADRHERKELKRVSGQRSIPTLVDGEVVVTHPEEIVAYLDDKFELRSDAKAHREKAIEEAELLTAPPPWPD